MSLGPRCWTTASPQFPKGNWIPGPWNITGKRRGNSCIHSIRTYVEHLQGLEVKPKSLLLGFAPSTRFLWQHPCNPSKLPPLLNGMAFLQGVLRRSHSSSRCPSLHSVPQLPPLSTSPEPPQRLFFGHPPVSLLSAWRLLSVGLNCVPTSTSLYWNPDPCTLEWNYIQRKDLYLIVFYFGQSLYLKRSRTTESLKVNPTNLCYRWRHWG